MSEFDKAKRLMLKDEALDTEKWLSDEELEKIFFVTEEEQEISKKIKKE